MRGTFRSLRVHNYRLWAAGSVVSNVGTWVQRTAQDWLVLTELTPHSATAVGIVMSLQFGPQLLLLPLTGLAADRFDRRRLLLATQTAMGVFALVLGLLTISGLVRLWHVYALAFLSGCAAAFDAPARQTFVAELVGEADLANAVALNSTSFNAARLVGPAVAGLLIAAVGSGWMFLINAASYVAVLASLLSLRRTELRAHGSAGGRGRLAAGFAYIRHRPDLVAILLMVFIIGTFGLNFAIFISTMSVSVFHGGPGQYGLLTSAMAAGSVAGALLSAGRIPGLAVLTTGSAAFGLAFAIAALAPDAWLFAASLMALGVAAQTVTTTAISLVQLTTDPALRGRVIAILLATALGGTPLGAPIVGGVADRFGPRWALAVGCAAGLAAAAVGLYHLATRAGPGADPATPAAAQTREGQTREGPPSLKPGAV